MAPFQSPDRANATLPRRGLLAGSLALAVSACEKPMPLTASTTPRLHMKRLNREAARIAERARPGVLGAGLMNLESGESWTFAGDRRFPMQSVFKAPLAAAVLSEVDARRLDLDEVVALDEMDHAPPISPIAEAWPARRDYSLRELLVAAARDSDNTAADKLMARIGGPGALTAWLQSKKIEEVRVDRYERELQPEAAGMAPFRPSWRGAAFQRLRARIPEAQRRAALARYMSDPRDTATPRGMLGFLAKLDSGELLSQASTRRLIEILAATTTGAGRLRAGFPTAAMVAHKTGSAGEVLGVSPATNDVGIVVLKDRRSYAAAVFLSGSTLDAPGRDGIVADVARLMAASVG
jgi:beta-lactamase class A